MTEPTTEAGKRLEPVVEAAVAWAKRHAFLRAWTAEDDRTYATMRDALGARHILAIEAEAWQAARNYVLELARARHDSWHDDDPEACPMATCRMANEVPEWPQLP